MKLKISLLLLLCPFFTKAAPAQSPPASLTIGDRLPDITVSNLANYTTTRLSLTTLRGKVLLIDFWATNCGSCIRALSRLENLQRRFGDSIMILPVSYEKRQLVAAFLRNNPNGKNLHLPVVTEDTLLQKRFPHRILSHDIWIDQSGTVRAITGPDYITENNIETLLHRQPFHLPVKKDLLAYDYSRPLNPDTTALYYSLLARYKPGIAPRSGVVTDSLRHRTRVWIINYPILPMYMLATDNLLYFPKTLLKISLQDTGRVHVPKGMYKEQWERLNCWCYEAVFPGTPDAATIKATMLSDLNRFFRFHAGMEKRQTPCLSLERLAATDSLGGSKGGTPLNTLHRSDTLKVLTNASLSNLVWELNDLPGGLPATDNTRFNQNVDLRLQLSCFRDLEKLNAALAPYHLVVRKRLQDMDFFVLEDENNADPKNDKPRK